MSKPRGIFLTNFVPPHRLPLYELLAKRFDRFKLLLSTAMEPNRNWKPEFGSLEVEVQNSYMFRQRWNHPKGFSETVFIHIPFDTIPKLIKYQPDFILSNELGLRSVFAAQYKLFNPRCKVIIWATLSESSEQGRGPLRHWLRRWLLPRVDGIIVNGHSGERYIRSVAKVSQPIFHVPQTTDMKLFFPLSAQRPKAAEQVYRLMYVGRMIALKGLPEFLQTLSKWASNHPERQLEFALVGDGPLRQEIEQTQWPANLKVVCHGHIPFNKVAEIYLTADLSIFPTLSEEWGCAVNEALATGLPMLGSVYSQGVEELVKDDINGWQMRPDDFAATYEVLDKALNSSQATRQRMIEAARRSVEPLTEDYIADLIEGAVYTVLNQDGKHGERLEVK